MREAVKVQRYDGRFCPSEFVAAHAGMADSGCASDGVEVP